MQKIFFETIRKMIIAKTLSEFEAAYRSLPRKSDIGFVPTMGALHQGHISLVKKSVSESSHTIVSIFVNPTQFNNKQDLENYPRHPEQDCVLLKETGVDIVFIPRTEDIYPEEDNRIFDLGGLDRYGEGPRRPGHFNGVAQVVTRLFDIVKPARAYFGEKDFQQVAIISYFVKNLNYPVRIVPCPIVREEDGLAKSSRNTLLTSRQREAAPHIYKTLCLAAEWMKENSPQQVAEKVKTEIDKNPLLETEYVEIVNAETLQPVSGWDEARHIRLWCAVYARPVRLIDNIQLK